jgi:hypothetical protein
MKGEKSRGKNDGARREAAETVAVAALVFLASEPEHLGRFLAATGIGPERIGDEALLIAFARSEGIDPSEVERARTRLGGNWERDLP